MKVIISLMTLFLLVTSCNTLMLGLITDKSITKKVKYLEHEKKEREIVFMPIVHLGSETYYDGARKIIDSLRKENFVFYYESVGYKTELDSLEEDIYNRKFRKLLGFHITSSYKDSTNKSLSNAFTTSKYIPQDYNKMGLVTEDVIVDLSKAEIIKGYEKEKGIIELTNYDYKIGLKEKYNCKDTTKYDDYFALHTLRDEHIIKTTLESRQKKIVMIYGKSHWYMIWAGLRDAGFIIKKGKING